MASSVPKKKQVSTLERYYPSLEEIKQTYPDNLNELFEKYGDELIFQDDPDGKTMHIFCLYKKLYKCIKKGCKSTLVVEEEKIPETKTPKGKKEKEEAEEDPKDKEKEDVKQEEKGVQGAIPKKKRKPRKKNKKGKNKNPNGQPEEKEK